MPDRTPKLGEQESEVKSTSQLDDCPDTVPGPLPPTPQVVDMPRGWPPYGLAPNQLIWHDYVVVDFLGMGNTGDTYQIAHSTEKNRPSWALKIMRPSRPSSYQEDILNLYKLNLHKLKEERGRRRFVQIIGSGVVPAGQRCGGDLFLVMELLNGMTLAALLTDLNIRGKRLSELDFLWISHEILAAMRDAHRSPDPIVHSGLRPSNIFLHRHLDRDTNEWGIDVVCLDLGLANAPTPPYSAPEVYDSRPGRISCITDVFSIGVMLYEMATGRLPYGLVHSEPFAVGPSTPLDLGPLRQRVDLRGLDEILSRALALEPQARYRDAGEMLNEFQILDAWQRYQRLQARVHLWTKGRQTEDLPKAEEAAALLSMCQPELLRLPYPCKFHEFVDAVRMHHIASDDGEGGSGGNGSGGGRRKGPRQPILLTVLIVLTISSVLNGVINLWTEDSSKSLFMAISTVSNVVSILLSLIAMTLVLVFQWPKEKPGRLKGTATANLIDLFCSYAAPDENLLRELEKHLISLTRQGILRAWHRGDIAAGRDKQIEVTRHLMGAQIILLLISADFLACEDCYGIEMEKALDRHYAGQARVIPIVLRATFWENSPFARLQCLPTDRKPVASWDKDKRDEAWAIISRAIAQVASEMRSSKGAEAL